MNTSRVPGVTRNSGWRSVSETIVEARAVRDPRHQPTFVGSGRPRSRVVTAGWDAGAA
ncbi:hypothetical protein [Friedmanniella luteola]|uniref:hypothetical protein n=1 Tax=Friedmanniella luteola TaxID=546871 RepID=UPI0012FD4B85|nr:hypothetical protein [Friedmanniella luteola]